jgi:hypothetical protein
MARIEVKGYANRPAQRQGKNGMFLTFSLNERQKDRNGEYIRIYYDVTDFKNNDVPDGSFVTVKGFFEPRPYKAKDGTEKTGLRITADAIEVSPPRGPAGGDNGSAAGSDFPF